MRDKEKVLLRCCQLDLGYEHQTIREDLNFSVEEGDYLCILGENGTGKSTLIKTILGLIKPVKGSVERNEHIVHKSIGYLPQQTQAQKDFPATVKEVVLSGCLSRLKFHPFYGKPDKEIARRNMEKLKISDLKKKCYRELSGGQQQRVLLARALCAADGMIVLDEPTTGLDPLSTYELYEILRYLNETENMTIVMVSHDIHNAIRQAKNILYLGSEDTFYGKPSLFVETEEGQKFTGGQSLCRES